MQKQTQKAKAKAKTKAKATATAVALSGAAALPDALMHRQGRATMAPDRASESELALALVEGVGRLVG